eukprot:11216983-Lingulodinium_polyedra.AAC.1
MAISTLQPGGSRGGVSALGRTNQLRPLGPPGKCCRRPGTPPTSGRMVMQCSSGSSGHASS